MLSPSDRACRLGAPRATDLLFNATHFARRQSVIARSETEDSTIADDRVAKDNQLLRIEEELGDNAINGGKIR
jgi:enolase